MEKTERTKLLIIALERERDQFKTRGQSTTEHDVAIEYLEKGKTDEDPEEFELLYACMEDFETICSDYGVPK
jgi:hypothetical protein